MLKLLLSLVNLFFENKDDIWSDVTRKSIIMIDMENKLQFSCLTQRRDITSNEILVNCISLHVSHTYVMVLGFSEYWILLFVKKKAIIELDFTVSYIESCSLELCRCLFMYVLIQSSISCYIVLIQSSFEVWTKTIKFLYKIKELMNVMSMDQYHLRNKKYKRNSNSEIFTVPMTRTFLRFKNAAL